LFNREIAFRAKSFTGFKSLLDDLFPDSNNVFPLGLDKTEDSRVWEYAKTNGFILVTKDDDFGDISILQGFPPKVIWIRRGNCTTAEIEKILRNNFLAIEQIEGDKVVDLLTLF
jgi:predicted nuclease of predicted toxin-antitoxin system